METGFDDPIDNYERGNLSAVTLKGLGEFDNEQLGRGIQFTVVIPRGFNMPREHEAPPVVDMPTLPEGETDARSANVSRKAGLKITSANGTYWE